MGYPLELDEYSAVALQEELVRRAELKTQGKCDYCSRELDSSPHCRFPERHYSSASKSDNLKSPINKST